MSKKKTAAELAAARLFGQNLRALRDEFGWEANDIARDLQISCDGLYKYERGVREPNLLMLLKMAAVFRVSLDKLITNNKPIRMLPFARSGELFDIVVHDEHGDLIYAGMERRENKSARQGPAKDRRNPRGKKTTMKLN